MRILLQQLGNLRTQPPPTPQRQGLGLAPPNL
jgi:hypothetical protein